MLRDTLRLSKLPGRFLFVRGHGTRGTDIRYVHDPPGERIAGCRDIHIQPKSSMLCARQSRSPCVRGLAVRHGQNSDVGSRNTQRETFGRIVRRAWGFRDWLTSPAPRSVQQLPAVTGERVAFNNAPQG